MNLSINTFNQLQELRISRVFWKRFLFPTFAISLFLVMSVGVAISPVLALTVSEMRTDAINESKLADGVVSGIEASDLEQSITNKPMIVDPTGKTEGYLLEDYTEDFFELVGSRGQTYRHFYNKTTGKYTYQSDLLVQKEGLVEGSNWVINDEYPIKFIVRLRDNTLRFFDTPEDAEQFIDSIDCLELWGVGVEMFEGILGFYLNYHDQAWGHGQYVYWPRLKDGKIIPYNMPLYALYPHLYTKFNGIWFDQILNDRSLYSIMNDPRQTLDFFISGSQIGIQYITSNVAIQGSKWNFVHGFKFDTIDNKYHMITDIQCLTHDFEDIGLAYEITSSPQSDGTPFQPSYFVLSNETNEVIVTIEQAWNAGVYLDDFFSQIEIISQDEETVFQFNFEDMELAGFTSKYLDLHNQQFPDNSIRKVLRAGMYGLGVYSKGTWIKIDPSTVAKYGTDNYDLHYRLWFDTWYKHGLRNTVGWWDRTATWKYYTFVAFDTGITEAITDTGIVVWQMYCDEDETESGEGVTAIVYNVKGNNDSNQAREDSMSYSLTSYYSTQTAICINPIEGAYNTFNTIKSESLTDYWAINRDNDDNYISFRLEGYGVDHGDNDRIYWTDSQYSEQSRDPKLNFTYVTEDYDYWALIVAGSMDNPDENNSRFMYDALNMFNTLNDTYDGFTNNSIFLLTPNATDDVSGDPIPRDRPTSKANVEWAIGQIAAFAESTDQVLIFWVSHGNENLIECENINNINETISHIDLAAALDEIDCNEMFIIVDACMSGSLIDDLYDEPNRAIYTAANSSWSSWGFEDPKLGVYGNWFAMATYYALDPDLNATYADNNPSDNRTSLREMWDYAYDFVMYLKTIYNVDQDPQRWVGASIGNDSLHYIYDGYYK